MNWRKTKLNAEGGCLWGSREEMLMACTENSNHNGRRNDIPVLYGK